MDPFDYLVLYMAGVTLVFFTEYEERRDMPMLAPTALRESFGLAVIWPYTTVCDIYRFTRKLFKKP